MPKRLLSKALLLALALGMAPLAAADWPLRAPEESSRAPEGRYFIAQRDGPSLSEAIEMVRRQYRGRIVSAETRRRGDREVHVIKVLTEDGKVKTVQIRGRSLRG